jgi:hypothetical protein
VRAVWKYTLPMASDEADILMPIGAEVLAVGNQGNNLCLWARVDPEAELETRRFRVRGTGLPGAEGEHVGTVLLYNGALVLHVFEAAS